MGWRGRGAAGRGGEGPGQHKPPRLCAEEDPAADLGLVWGHPLCQSASGPRIQPEVQVWRRNERLRREWEWAPPPAVRPGGGSGRRDAHRRRPRPRVHCPAHWLGSAPRLQGAIGCLQRGSGCLLAARIEPPRRPTTPQPPPTSFAVGPSRPPPSTRTNRNSP
jgi:hypothetical protein